MLHDNFCLVEEVNRKNNIVTDMISVIRNCALYFFILSRLNFPNDLTDVRTRDILWLSAFPTLWQEDATFLQFTKTKMKMRQDLLPFFQTSIRCIFSKESLYVSKYSIIHKNRNNVNAESRAKITRASNISSCIDFESFNFDPPLPWNF